MVPHPDLPPFSVSIRRALEDASTFRASACLRKRRVMLGDSAVANAALRPKLALTWESAGIRLSQTSDVIANGGTSRCRVQSEVSVFEHQSHCRNAKFSSKPTPMNSKKPHPVVDYRVERTLKTLVDRTIRKQRREERRLAEQRTTKYRFQARQSCIPDARSYRIARRLLLLRSFLSFGTQVQRKRPFIFPA